MNDIVSTNTNSFVHIFFDICDITYAIPVYCIVEVLPFCQLQAPQRLQKYVIGLLDYNGLMLNVIDLKELLGFSKNSFNINQKLLIIKTEDSMFAIVTDKITDIKDVSNSMLQLAPYNETNFIQSIYNTSTETASVINIPVVEEVIKKAENLPNEEFLLPVLNEEDTQIAKKRAEKIKNKNQTYFVAKYSDFLQFLVFEVAQIKFCIDIAHLEKVIDVSSVNIMPIPTSVNYIEGIANFRGGFLTIINFTKFMEQPQNDFFNDKNNKIIVIKTNNYNVGFLVNKIFEISNFTTDEIQSSNEFSSISPFITKQVVKNDEVYFIIDLDVLMKDNKMYINQ